MCSRANTIGVFIGMRVLQSLGASAVLSLGGGMSYYVKPKLLRLTKRLLFPAQVHWLTCTTRKSAVES